VQLTEHDALGAHAEAELGIDPDNLTNPWHAAWASMTAFTAGALIPLVAGLVVPVTARIPVTALAVVIALVLTGWTSARFGDAPRARAVVRNVAGGLLAMAVTYAIGSLVGTQL
jgi:VIT1/CCC1 family predicted Fe2+/Mn2+ transporter